jgi:hypothetical protein
VTSKSYASIGSLVEKSLTAATFESGSRLCRIDQHAFSCCSSLSSICIPASVDEESRNFGVCGNLLTDFQGVSAIHYYGFVGTAAVSRGIKIMCPYCFSG